MNSDILALLCDPITHDPLEIKTEPDMQGQLHEFLVNPKTSQRFPIREDIPIFLDNVQVSGSNKRYQAMYDRMAVLAKNPIRLGFVPNRIVGKIL